MQIYNFEVTDSSFESKILDTGFDPELVLPEICEKNFSQHVVGYRNGYIWRPGESLSSDVALQKIKELTCDGLTPRPATAEELLSFEIGHKELCDGTVLVALGEKAHVDQVSGIMVLVRLGSNTGKELSLYPWDVVWNEQTVFLVIFE